MQHNAESMQYSATTEGMHTAFRPVEPEVVMRNQLQKTVLVVGASGATGRLLVARLLNQGENVRAVVRSVEGIPLALRNHPRLNVIHATLLELDAAALKRLTHGCDAVASCLGHNLSLKGLFGPPYRLVTEATRRLAVALKANGAEFPVRFVLMNTAGNRNRDVDEPVSLAQKLVIGLIRLTIPPHADNETAADFLRQTIGQDDNAMEWCVVRPDSLIDEPEETEYEVFPSPIRSAIFDPGKTSRRNVACFMAELVVDDESWRRWRGGMPVIYNKTSA
jgi:putative NADH-flavin reductase